jgi:hypothetical protein
MFFLSSDSELIIAGGRGTAGTFSTVEKYNVQTGEFISHLEMYTKFKFGTCTVFIISNAYSQVGFSTNVHISTGAISLPQLVI